MKKFLVLLPLLAAGFGAFCLSLSCSTKAPSSPNNFQTAVSIISAINPTLTFTPTSTFTATFTFTPTSTITATPSPYVTVAPWTGLKSPSGITVDSNGFVYVADTGNNQVKKFNPSGTLVTSWGNGGKGKGAIAFSSPQCLAVNSTGTILYMLGAGTAGIFEYDGFGNFIGQLNTINFTNPKGIALDGSGNIYVSDTANSRIVQMTSGGVTTGFGAITLTGTLAVPVTIAASPVTIVITAPVSLSGLAINNGSVYVATQGMGINGSGYSTLLAFNTVSGNITAAIPGFNNPSGIAFDSNNNLYVADTGNKQVEEFVYGTNQPPIIFSNGGLLNSPIGVAVYPFNTTVTNIYVTDSVTNEVIDFTP